MQYQNTHLFYGKLFFGDEISVAIEFLESFRHSERNEFDNNRVLFLGSDSELFGCIGDKIFHLQAIIEHAPGHHSCVDGWVN